MENASKALIMAGSILIALLTIGALMFMFDNISGVEKQKDQNAEIEATLEFNRQFEAFDTVGLRGTDILTIMNKMVNYNEKVIEDDDDGYKTMSMQLTMKQDIGNGTNLAAGRIYELNYSSGHTGELKSIYDEWFETTKNEELTEFKRSYFKCTGIEYDNTTGRVSSMSFEQIVVQ